MILRCFLVGHGLGHLAEANARGSRHSHPGLQVSQGLAHNQKWPTYTPATRGESAEISNSGFGPPRTPGSRFPLLVGPGVGQTEGTEMAEAAN